ncbi:MAG: hypothetical protein IPM82_06315 [Saprospiraceae bacterium]|nr:hypothetical protein [Saprospiraceae bacterium]
MEELLFLMLNFEVIEIDVIKFLNKFIKKGFHNVEKVNFLPQIEKLIVHIDDNQKLIDFYLGYLQNSFITSDYTKFHHNDYTIDHYSYIIHYIINILFNKLDEGKAFGDLVRYEKSYKVVYEDLILDYQEITTI